MVQRLPYSQSVSTKYTTCVPEASTDGVSGLKVSPVIPGSDDSQRIVVNNSGSCPRTRPRISHTFVISSSFIAGVPNFYACH